MYADDTQLYVAIDSVEDRPAVLNRLELCVRDIIFWCTSNGLARNPDKTEVVHISSRFPGRTIIPNIPEIDIGGFKISHVPAARDLGVIVDSHFTLSSHVNNIYKAAYL